MNRIPVTVALSEIVPDPNVALVRLARLPGHDHGRNPCPGCMAALDVRARLADLLAAMEVEGEVPFSEVLVLASDTASAEDARRALRGEVPARALRDHQVARRFELSDHQGIAFS